MLVHITFSQLADAEDLVEFRELAHAAGAAVCDVIGGSRARPDAKTFVGKGKCAEIKDAAIHNAAQLVIFNHELSPAQERNLERELQCRVLDRVGLILDIFAKRAHTFEGKLQVELAQLEHLSTRLVRGWTHLERQKGGIGLRGPGETQLETDRRLLRNRIKSIQKSLSKVRARREQSRRGRRRAELKTVALVGYTNAGKSTLFNHLTQASVYTADKLFATLDPTLRRIEIKEIGPVILTDTVGFVRHLPHELIEAFRATLEETAQATLLLHVVDASNPDHKALAAAVNEVLTTIGADKVPQLVVYNKTDLLDDESARLDVDETSMPTRVWLSAQTGEGIDLLYQALSRRLQAELKTYHITLTPKQGKIRAALYKRQCVLAEDHDEQGHWLLTVRLSAVDFERYHLQSG